MQRSGLPESEKIAARVDCKQVLDKFKSSEGHPKHNKNEFKILKEIREKDVYVMKPDKGKAVVIMDKADYEEKKC